MESYIRHILTDPMLSSGCHRDVLRRVPSSTMRRKSSSCGLDRPYWCGPCPLPWVPRVRPPTNPSIWVLSNTKNNHYRIFCCVLKSTRATGDPHSVTLDEQRCLLWHLPHNTRKAIYKLIGNLINLPPDYIRRGLGAPDQHLQTFRQHCIDN
jgi:hypothetical protein